MTEAELCDKLNRSDKSALKWLFENYYTKLVHYALKITSDPEASEEIVQELFISIWKNREKLSVDSFYAYLSRAVRNKCITYIQSEFRKTESIESIMYAIEEPRNQNDIELDELKGALKEAENILPKKTRLVFSLSRHSEMTYNEISSELEISVKTVEYHISKAFKLMKEFMASRGFEISIIITMLML